MKGLLSGILILVSMNLNAQTTDKEAIKQTIATFFKGFHQQDSSIIKKVVSKEVIAQTIAKNKDGHAFVRNEDFSNFMKAIVSIPDSINYEEKLLSFHIQVDGKMANAWTEYEFWYNNKFSHCGVNSFQLFKDGGYWKIIYLIDTRRRKGCGDQ